MSSLKPLGDNVLVQPIQAETTTKSGIVIPDTANKEKPMRGKIVALPEATDDQNPSIQQLAVGMTVYFTKYAPTEVKIDGEEYYILDAKSVLAIETN